MTHTVPVTFSQVLLQLLTRLVTDYGPISIIVLLILFILHRLNMTGWWSNEPMSYKDALLISGLWPVYIIATIIFLIQQGAIKLFSPLGLYMAQLWDGPPKDKL